ncbi:hypothetical protein [Ferviditalea candida]|uniref:Uncharacterized protein n=1 Tax=Ferviditalea candida TaxID=3108399 RepID=A0ABU5ZI54_9BACL|nr:hypothetical protein [Paenibacillaceae bacterium T2]
MLNTFGAMIGYFIYKAAANYEW